jgi:UPF0042 nucleotide-binding protein
MNTVEIVSFGYGHGTPPDATITYDVRTHFRDPHINPELRYLTAEHPDVAKAVLTTPGVPRLIEAIVYTITAYQQAPTPGPITVAVGCAGGRHRAATIAARAAGFLANAGTPVTLTHRDMAKPVLERT